MFAPKIVLTEMPPVVAPDHDDGVFLQLEVLQCGQHVSCEFVRVAGGGEVAMEHHPVPFVGADFEVTEVVGRLFPAAPECGRSATWAEAVFGNLDFLPFVEVPVFGGRVEWHVGANETAAEEKRLAGFFQPLEVGDRFLGHQAIVVGVRRAHRPIRRSAPVVCAWREPGWFPGRGWCRG